MKDLTDKSQGILSETPKPTQPPASPTGSTTQPNPAPSTPVYSDGIGSACDAPIF